MFLANNDLLFPDDGYTGRTLVDDYTIPVFHSTSQVSALYSRPIFTLRRDSDDAEKDFYLDSNYEFSLDSEDGFGISASTWVGSNSAYIKKWFNQGAGGSTWDVDTITKTKQLRIINAGVLEVKGGKACPRLDAGDQLTATGNTFTDADYPNAWTWFCVSAANATGVYSEWNPISGVRLFTDSRTSPNRHLISGSTQLNLSTAYNNTDQVLKTAIIDGASSAVFDNGNAGGTGTISSYSNSLDYRIGDATNVNPFYLQEFFIISSNASDDRVAIEAEIKSYYSIL